MRLLSYAISFWNLPESAPTSMQETPTFEQQKKL
jgi:hypothetical protein